ncbi:MAG: hypothetical protein NVV72_13910 [Asticcacaulis sp.]|nr:hypothetical protein [Asticcacaulis sp.]
MGKSGGTLDFVAAWFIKAGDYVQHSSARIGFVSTNSITQGEQVAQLWPILFNRHGLEIAFAHRTFNWGSDARGKAHVHVVAIGLTRRDDEPAEKRLFSYPNINSEPEETRHSALSPYLFDASKLADRHLVVREASKPLSNAPKVVIGSKPIDGGYYIMSGSEKDVFLAAEPGAAPYIRPYIGSEEYINGGDRWIAVVDGVPPQTLRSLPRLISLVEKVRLYRLGELPPRSKPEGEAKKATEGSLALALTPTKFHVTVIPDEPFLCIPEVSSERREYAPIGWLEPPIVPSNLVKVVRAVTKWQFAVLTSATHMAWLRNIGGRLKSDYRYSNGLVYNTFPWPKLTDADKAKLNALAQAVLDARAAHPGATLADLYDPDVMPADLRKAHRALDLVVDRLYRKAPFESDRERVEHLFMLYEKMTAGLLATPEKKKRKAKTA